MRLSLGEAIDLTIASLQAYGSERSTWVVGYSGGKDSTATVTLIDHLIKSGKLQRPENLIVAYSDTLMELPPLEASAHQLLSYLQGEGWQVRRTVPEIGQNPQKKTERFFLNMLGRGYPPPNGRFRWCTDRMKARKVDAIYKSITDEYGTDFLGIDGIRKGESAARDQIIVASCSKEDGECGQGWFHKSRTGDGYKLSPLLHWRICNVWDWLVEANYEHRYPIDGVFETYGMGDFDPDVDEPLATRTGCIGCPLVTTGNESKPKPDKALETVLNNDKWSHLAPYRKLSDIYWRLRWDRNCRHINLKGHKGCLTIPARQWALDEIMKLQSESARLALEKGVKPYVLIPDEEVNLIRQMHRDRVFPDPGRYDPEELNASSPIE